jgi:hypothetical protein
VAESDETLDEGVGEEVVEGVGATEAKAELVGEALALGELEVGTSALEVALESGFWLAQETESRQKQRTPQRRTGNTLFI